MSPFLQPIAPHIAHNSPHIQGTATGTGTEMSYMQKLMLSVASVLANQVRTNILWYAISVFSFFFLFISLHRLLSLYLFLFSSVFIRIYFILIFISPLCILFFICYFLLLLLHFLFPLILLFYNSFFIFVFSFFSFNFSTFYRFILWLNIILSRIIVTSVLFHHLLKHSIMMMLFIFLE